MQISICMMVKNEEKNIRRCLNSIKPILENIESELIVVDTGSEDNTVEIVREYTDKIFFHKWENDFSGMRNKSISYAKGDWIFIIDADEEVIDCNNIIHFLKSDKSKPFTTGLLNVKNIESIHNSEHYAMLKSPRIFKNDGEFRYEGIVHNNPIFKEPTIDLETILVHYGYIKENEEIANKKFIRTSNLLKKALEKDPYSIYYIFQLSVTYRSHKEYLNAYETIKEAYKLLDACNDKNRYKYVYYQMALCSIDLHEDEFAKEVCKNGLKLDKQYIDLMFYLAKAQGLTGEYKESIKTYKKYIDLCNNYYNMSINFDVSLGMYTLGQVDEALQDIAKMYFKLGEFDEVLNFASQIKNNKYIQNIIELIIKAALNQKNMEYIKSFYEEKIIGDKLKEDNFFMILGKQNNEDIFKSFSNHDNEYFKLYYLRHNYNKKDDDFCNIINKFSFNGDLNNLEDCFGDIIYYKLKYCSYIPNILENVWEKNINRYLSYILRNYEDFSEIVIKYLNNFNEIVDYDNLRINKILCKYVLLIDKIDDFIYEEVFKYYLDIGIKWIKYIYNSNLIANDNAIMDEEEKFLSYMSIAVENRKNDKIYIKYLRKSLNACPYMRKGIEILSEELNRKIEADNSNEEIENYKVQIKQIIKTFIDNEDLESAEALIKEYESIISNDFEILLFKSQISITKLKLNNNKNEYKM